MNTARKRPDQGNVIPVGSRSQRVVEPVSPIPQPELADEQSILWVNEGSWNELPGNVDPSRAGIVEKVSSWSKLGIWFGGVLSGTVPLLLSELLKSTDVFKKMSDWIADINLSIFLKMFQKVLDIFPSASFEMLTLPQCLP
jgi:hypothetical protein